MSDRQEGQHSDWVNLPHDVCKQVLCFDLNTFVSGQRVCHEWRTLTKQASWGPGNITLPINFRLFHLSEPIIDKLDRIVKLVQRLAGPATHTFDLKVSLGCADGAELQPLLSKLQDYSMLTTLKLDCGVLKDWSFVANLPECITSIELSVLSATSQACSWEDRLVSKSLDCFNKFHELKQMQLRFGCIFLVSGSLDLPCLEELHFTADYDVDADDLRLDKLPLSCIIVTCYMHIVDRFERDWTWLDESDEYIPLDWALIYQSQLDTQQ